MLIGRRSVWQTVQLPRTSKRAEGGLTGASTIDGAVKRDVKSGFSAAVLFVVGRLRDGLGHPLSDCAHVAIDALDALVCVLAAR